MERRTRIQGSTVDSIKPKRVQCEGTNAPPLPKPLTALLPKTPNKASAYQSTTSGVVDRALLPFTDGLLVLTTDQHTTATVAAAVNDECSLPPTTKVLCALVDGKVQFYSRSALLQRGDLDLHSTTQIPYHPRSADECPDIIARWHHYHKTHPPPFTAWRCVILDTMTTTTSHNQSSVSAACHCAMIIRSGGGAVLACPPDAESGNDDELNAVTLLNLKLTHLIVADELREPVVRWVNENALSPIVVETFNGINELVLTDKMFVAVNAAESNDQILRNSAAAGTRQQQLPSHNLFINPSTTNLSVIFSQSTTYFVHERLRPQLHETLRMNRDFNKAVIGNTSMLEVDIDVINHVENSLNDPGKYTSDALFVAMSLLPKLDASIPSRLFLHMFRVALEGLSNENQDQIIRQKKQISSPDPSNQNATAAVAGVAAPAGAPLTTTGDFFQYLSLSSMTDTQEDVYFNGAAFLQWFGDWQQTNFAHLAITRQTLLEVLQTLCRQYTTITSEVLDARNLYSLASDSKRYAPLLYNFIFMLLSCDEPDVEQLRKLNQGRGGNGAAKTSSATTTTKTDNKKKVTTKPTIKQNGSAAAASSSNTLKTFEDFEGASSSSSSSGGSGEDDEPAITAEVTNKVRNDKKEKNDLQYENALNEYRNADKATAVSTLGEAQLKLERFLVQRVAAERIVEYLQFDLAAQVAAGVAARSFPADVIKKSSSSKKLQSSASVKMEDSADEKTNVDVEMQDVNSKQNDAEFQQNISACFSTPLTTSPVVSLLNFAPVGRLQKAVNESAKKRKLKSSRKKNSANTSFDSGTVISKTGSNSSSGSSGSNNATIGSTRPPLKGNTRAAAALRAKQQAAEKQLAVAASAASMMPIPCPVDSVRLICTQMFDELAVRLVAIVDAEVSRYVRLHDEAEAAAAAAGAAVPGGAACSLIVQFIRSHDLQAFLTKNKAFYTWTRLVELLLDAASFEFHAYSAGGEGEKCSTMLMPIVNNFVSHVTDNCRKLMLSMSPSPAVRHDSTPQSVANEVLLALSSTTTHLVLRYACLQHHIVNNMVLTIDDDDTTSATSSSGPPPSLLHKSRLQQMSARSLCRLYMTPPETPKNQNMMMRMIKCVFDLHIYPFIAAEKKDVHDEKDGVYSRLFSLTKNAVDSSLITVVDLCDADEFSNSKTNWSKTIHEIGIRISSSQMESGYYKFAENCAVYHCMNKAIVAERYTAKISKKTAALKHNDFVKEAKRIGIIIMA